MVVAVPKDYRSKPGEYGETKKQKQFLMTPTASDLLDSMVAEYSTTRSDLLERVVRGLAALGKEARDHLMLEMGVIEEEGDRQ
ncbi:hypothetical protein [Leptolyngbya sp. FACHB-16]|uniref:hypothetical protein n=1 Tax=unclassified Leptolyngbya TaxID=2650499 RepID=UPI0016879B6D|nr:hypothetical protein [Leptolyngbya sp. FACHB-16]MBD2153150.1 hypothetical protein [Leptolyngbya sp. FACHB-16]